MKGPGGSSITHGPSFRSRAPAPYGVSEFAVNATARGPTAAISIDWLSTRPAWRLPLKMPSVETVGYQKRYAVIARW